MKKQLFILFLLLSFCISTVYSQFYTGRQLQNALKKIDSNETFKSANWACVFKNVKDGKVIASINPYKPLIPASTLKLAITYPAYKILGNDFHFQTFIEYDGLISEGVLTGNIYVRGGGDPSLGSWRFPGCEADSVFFKILSFLKSAGITKIDGGLIGDSEVFDDKLIPGSWTWDDIGNYYGSGVSGLNFHENMMEIVFQPGKKIGDAAKVIRIEPPIQDLNFDNEVTTADAASGDQVILYGAPYDNHRVFTGSVPLGKDEFIVKGSLPDPAQEMLNQLYKYLIINNIEIKFQATTTKKLLKQGVKVSQSRIKLGVITSPSLLEIIQLTHEKSINLYADCLLKMIGKKSGSIGSYSTGIDAVIKFWTDKKLNVAEWVLKDGSGLSVSNRICCDLQSDMISIIAKDKNATDFFQTLNQAGISGDMKTLFTGGDCIKNLWAKSGYMKTVRAYTGIIKTKKNGVIAFSILVNHSGNAGTEIKTEIKKLLELFCAYGE